MVNEALTYPMYEPLFQGGSIHLFERTSQYPSSFIAPLLFIVWIRCSSRLSVHYTRFRSEKELLGYIPCAFSAAAAAAAAS